MGGHDVAEHPARGPVVAERSRTARIPEHARRVRADLDPRHADDVGGHVGVEPLGVLRVDADDDQPPTGLEGEQVAVEQRVRVADLDRGRRTRLEVRLVGQPKGVQGRHDRQVLLGAEDHDPVCCVRVHHERVCAQHHLARARQHLGDARHRRGGAVEPEPQHRGRGQAGVGDVVDEPHVVLDRTALERGRQGTLGERDLLSVRDAVEAFREQLQQHLGLVRGSRRCPARHGLLRARRHQREQATGIPCAVVDDGARRGRGRHEVGRRRGGVAQLAARVRVRRQGAHPHRRVVVVAGHAFGPRVQLRLHPQVVRRVGHHVAGEQLCRYAGRAGIVVRQGRGLGLERR